MSRITVTKLLCFGIVPPFGYRNRLLRVFGDGEDSGVSEQNREPPLHPAQHLGSDSSKATRVQRSGGRGGQRRRAEANDWHQSGTENPLGIDSRASSWSSPFPLPTPLGVVAPSAASAPFDGRTKRNLPSVKPWRRTRTPSAFRALLKVRSAIPRAVVSLSTSVA